eukprot:m.141790 g.141790  ORF g.141790 m.141790 type:complete len:119 (-) comp16139_c1_seq1:795-1151(-)
MALGPPGLDLSTAVADAYLVLNTSSQQLSRQTTRPKHPDLKLLSVCIDPVVQLKKAAACLGINHKHFSILCQEGVEEGCGIPLQQDSNIERSMYVDQLRNWLCAGNYADTWVSPRLTC